MTHATLDPVTTSFRYAILGPVELRDGDGVRGVGGPVQVALLAYLLLHANELRTRDQLVDAVWDGDGSPKTVQMAIARLRKALDQEPGEEFPLRTIGGGYLLAVADGELDAQAFRRGLATGKDALAGRRYAEAAGALREAESLWRAAPLADVTYANFAQETIRGLEAERTEAFDLRVQAELELGLHFALVGELEQRLSADPTDERLGEHLMLAYYRCGRQNRALETYQRLRVALQDELAARPGPGLRAMHERILNQSGSLALARASDPVHDRRWPLPLPSALESALASDYVGRAGEWAQLRAIVDAVESGRREVVWLAGDGGIGKTALAAQVGRYAHREAGCTVAYGAPGGEFTVPYGLWIGALTHLVKHAPYGPLKAHVATYDAELSRLVPALRDQLEPLPAPRRSHPDAERSLLFGAVVGWLEALCDAGPLALVLDDLHWADRPSIALLAHVIAATEGLPLLLVLPYRHTQLPLDHPLRELLPEGRPPGVQWLRLRGLQAADVAQLMTGGEGTLGADGLRMAARIQDETGGNPFEIGELLRPLQESGALARDDEGLWSVDVEVAELSAPEGVRGVVTRRVERLGERAAAVLGVAAVIGVSFDLDLLERLVDASEDELLTMLEAAERAELVAGRPGAPGHYSFAHALIGKAIYTSLSDARRLRTHRRVAEALEALAPEERVAELAHHWGRVDPRGGKAGHYARLAGERALGQLAPEEAVVWFERALELSDGDEGERCDLLISLGEAERRSDRKGFGATLLAASEIALRRQEPERLTRAVVANTLGPLGAAGERDEGRIAMLERALGVVAPSWPGRPHLVAVLAKELYFGGDPAEGARLSAEALQLARGNCERRELARVMALAAATSPIVPLERHCSLVDELSSLAREVDDPELRFRAAVAGFMCGMHRGRRTLVDDSLAEMARLDAQLREPLLHWHVLWARSACETLAGELAAGEALALEAEAEEHGRSQDVIAFGQLLSVYTEWRRLDELRERLEYVIRAYPAMPILTLARGFIDAETGRLDAARAVLERAAALNFRFPYDRTRAFDLARCADIALRVGARDSAVVLYAKLLEYRRYFATVSGISSRGSVELALGRLASMLERFADADEHLGAAERLHAKFGAPLLQARTALAQAQSLDARGDGERGAPYVEAALRLGRPSAAITHEAQALLAG